MKPKNSVRIILLIVHKRKAYITENIWKLVWVRMCICKHVRVCMCVYVWLCESVYAILYAYTNVSVPIQVRASVSASECEYVRV